MPYRVKSVSNDNQLDLERLRGRLREKPRTKVGQVRQAWPYIKELFAAGHSLKDICTWLNEVGIEIGYARLSHYVGQLRRAEEPASPVASAVETAALPLIPSGELPAAAPRLSQDGDAPGPLANLLDRETKRPGFHFNADPDPKKLI